jgi:hypothetical protein
MNQRSTSEAPGFSRGLGEKHISNSQAPPEMTAKAVAVVLFLDLIFGAANSYLGMKA